jgi:hypothetical protein
MPVVSGTIPVAQLATDVLARLGQKGEDGLMALFATVLGVVSLASSHLLTEARMHRVVGVQRHFPQCHVSGLPHALSQGALDLQDLPGHAQM